MEKDSDLRTKRLIVALIVADELNVEAALVSVDAMDCNRTIVEKIISKKGDYLLALKNNQKSLYEEASDWMNSRKPEFDKTNLLIIRVVELKTNCLCLF